MVRCVQASMARPRAILAGFLLVVVVISMTSTQLAADEGTYATYLLDGYTFEGQTNVTEVELEGDELLSAWFNFTILEDVVPSDPDSFQIRVTNVDNPSITSVLPGTTDVDGRLSMNMPFTLKASPSWTVAVTCTEAGDRMLGPVVIERDAGNDWSCQVEYIYTKDDGGNGNGNGNGDGTDGDDDGKPLLVTVFEANLVVVALLSLLVAFLALQAFRGEGGLRYPLIVSLVIAVNAFFALPVAILVNLELNDTAIGIGPYGPEWLGTLAIVLLVVWVVPFVLARKTVLMSRDIYNLLSRVALEGTAKKVRKRGQSRPDDQLTDTQLSLVLMGVGLASVVVVAMMLLA